MSPTFGYYTFYPDNPPGGLIYKYDNDTSVMVFSSEQYALWPSCTEMINHDTVLVTGFDLQNNAIVLKTSDAGLNWSEVKMIENQEIYDIKFINNSLGFIVGKEGLILRTTDTGNTWDSIPNDSTKTLRDIDFSTDNTGFIIGDLGIWGFGNLEMWKCGNVGI